MVRFGPCLRREYFWPDEAGGLCVRVVVAEPLAGFVRE